jgi:GT2 family glycosyltransferase
MLQFPEGRSAVIRLAVIVPFHRNLQQLRQCLTALREAGSALPSTAELSDLIVAADGAVDDPAEVAAAAGARVVTIAGPRGPAVARTIGAATAAGDLLVFVDTDVVAHTDSLTRLAALFVADPDLGAAFGAYDEAPADPGFFSQCRNLAHSYIHQRGNREAQTFWAGLGAIRANVFAAVGGFDERFTHPSVEDIDLGYRLRMAGFRIVLDPEIRGKHLKRWTLRSSVMSDIWDRGIPWTQLLKRYGTLNNDLNITFAYRACVVLAYLVVMSLIASWWRPVLLGVVPVGLGALWFLDRQYYRFFVTRRGLPFALGWFPFHVLHHLCNGLSFVIGTMLYLGQRLTGGAVPGALPLTPWSGAPVARVGSTHGPSSAHS